MELMVIGEMEYKLVKEQVEGNMEMVIELLKETKMTIEGIVKISKISIEEILKLKLEIS